MSMYVAMCFVCIVRVSKEDEYKKRPDQYNIGILDELYRAFPVKHCMHFQWNESSDGQAIGLGDLGMIDFKDVPLLVLQLLICKC